MGWNFSYVQGGAVPPSKPITAHCRDTATLTIEQPPMNVGLGVDRPWLRLTPLGGLTPLAMQVAVDPATLAPGTYTGHVQMVMTAEPVDGSLPIAPVTLTVAAPTPPPPTGTILLVDFADPPIFRLTPILGMPDWTTVIKDTYTEYRPIGPGGMTIVVGDNWTYNYQGITGGPRPFSAGDKIRMTWFNASAIPITFTPKIGFVVGRPDATWQDMSVVRIQPNDIAVSEYTFLADSMQSVINVNVNYQNNSLLIADKLEWIPVVIAPPPVVLPTIKFVTPDGTTFKTNDKVFAIQVSTGCVKVSLFVNDIAVPVGQQCARPGFTLPSTVNPRWEETSIPKGTYTLKAVAVNAAGLVSLPATITVRRV